MEKSQKEIVWTAPEFHYHHKSASWYWKLIGAAIVLAFISIWMKNFLFAVFIVIAAGTAMVWARRYPKHLDFKIDLKGVHIEKMKSYSYEELAGFAVKSGFGQLGELILQKKSKLDPYVKINIHNEDADEIKGFLKNRLEEIEYTDSLSDAISDMLKF